MRSLFVFALILVLALAVVVLAADARIARIELESETLFSEYLREIMNQRVPATCAEDVVLIGRGNFESGFGFAWYVCGFAVDDYAEGN